MLLKALHLFTFTRYLLESDIKILPLVLLNLIIDYLDDGLDNESSFKFLTSSHGTTIFDVANLDISFFNPQVYKKYLKELEKKPKLKRIEDKKSDHDSAPSPGQGSCIIS